MSQHLTIGLAQMTSGCRFEPNIATLEHFAREAVAQGCDLLALPEVAGLMQRDFNAASEIVTGATDDPWQTACSRVAKETGLWVHSGSSPVRGVNGKFRNRTTLVDGTGVLVAEYSKIHLFDVDLANAAPIRESDRYEPGEIACVLSTPWGRWGLTICYDLRFPALFRAYAQRGAQVIFVPSAFAVQTGEAHWHALLRARAIENGAWIIAAAQVGQHADGRKSYGHSLVVDPWGRIVEDMGGTTTGLAVVRIDLSLSDQARAQVPSLSNDRPYTVMEL